MDTPLPSTSVPVRTGDSPPLPRGSVDLAAPQDGQLVAPGSGAAPQRAHADIAR